MAQKKIIFVIIAFLFVLSLSDDAHGQTPVPEQTDTSFQYLPFITIPSPYDIYLKSYSEYIEGTYHYVVGELYNQSNTIYYDAGVTIEIIGQNMNTYRTIRTFIRCVNPHQTTPFKVVFNGLSEPAQVSHISWSWTGSPNYPPCQPAQIELESFHDNFGTTFYICVSNVNPKPMYSLSIIVTLYDSAGIVVGVEKDTYPVLMPPHSDISCPLEGLYTSYRAGQFSSFKAQAEGFTFEESIFP